MSRPYLSTRLQGAHKIWVWRWDYSWLYDWSPSHYRREEPPKPTTGLEYTYGRRSKGANIVRVNYTLRVHSSCMHNWSLIPSLNWFITKWCVQIKWSCTGDPAGILAGNEEPHLPEAYRAIHCVGHASGNTRPHMHMFSAYMSYHIGRKFGEH